MAAGVQSARPVPARPFGRNRPRSGRWMGNVRARWALRSAPAVSDRLIPTTHTIALTGPRTAGWAPSGASLLMSFDGLGLSPELLLAVSDEGYTTPTPVQAAAIPAVLDGRDVLAGAQTGTGKTAAFVLPIIQTLHATRRDGGEKRHRVRVLVVVPTRELAIQVEESVRTYGRHRPVRSATVYGGVGIGPQITKLRAGPEVVVATPGRLLDHVDQRTIDLSARRGPRPRRGGPDARHGLHPGHPQDPRAAPAAPAEPPVLGHLLGRDPRPRRRPAPRPGADPGHAAQHHDRAHRPARDPGRPRAQARPAARARRAGPRQAGARVHPHQARREPPRRCSSRRTASGPPRSTATRARRSACARSTTSRPAASTCSSRPTWPRAASTSSSCRTSSTSSCRWSPRTTSTGSAAPVAPAWTGRRSRSCASTSSRSSRRSSSCSGGRSRWRPSPGSSRTAPSVRSRSGCGRRRPSAPRPPPTGATQGGSQAWRTTDGRPSARSACAARCHGRSGGGQPRGDDAFVSRPTGASGGRPQGSGPRRRRSRGGGAGAPGTGFGNGAPSGQHAYQPRNGDRRPQGSRRVDARLGPRDEPRLRQRRSRVRLRRRAAVDAGRAHQPPRLAIRRRVAPVRQPAGLIRGTFERARRSSNRFAATSSFSRCSASRRRASSAAASRPDSSNTPQ